jgi:hypothetical protein
MHCLKIVLFIYGCFYAVLGHLNEESCSATLVESIPLEVDLPISSYESSTYEAWKNMIENAQYSIDLGKQYKHISNRDYNEVIVDPLSF